MIAAEEFTFPAIRSAIVNLALLPPLWRISDGADSDQCAGRQRRTFASQIFKIDDALENDDGAEAESREKMDLLWEDLNEELKSTAASSDPDFNEETIQHRNSDLSYRGDLKTLEECANVRHLKLIRAKPKKMESLVKVMKKLFSPPQNTARRNQRNRT